MVAILVLADFNRSFLEKEILTVGLPALKDRQSQGPVGTYQGQELSQVTQAHSWVIVFLASSLRTLRVAIVLKIFSNFLITDLEFYICLLPTLS